jgi:hypothetical protein
MPCTACSCCIGNKSGFAVRCRPGAADHQTSVGFALQRGCVKTRSQPEVELDSVHRHIGHEGQFVEIHRGSRQAAGHVAARSWRRHCNTVQPTEAWTASHPTNASSAPPFPTVLSCRNERLEKAEQVGANSCEPVLKFSPVGFDNQQVFCVQAPVETLSTNPLNPKEPI